MKSEKELIWLFYLLKSDYTGGTIRKLSGCKKDFERLLNANENDKSFAEWFESLIESGIVYPSNQIEVGKGQKVQGYRVDKDLLLDRISQNEHYAVIWKGFSDESMFGTDMPKPKND